MDTELYEASEWKGELTSSRLLGKEQDRNIENRKEANVLYILKKKLLNSQSMQSLQTESK